MGGKGGKENEGGIPGLSPLPGGREKTPKPEKVSSWKEKRVKQQGEGNSQEGEKRVDRGGSIGIRTYANKSCFFGDAEGP